MNLRTTLFMLIAASLLGGTALLVLLRQPGVLQSGKSTAGGGAGNVVGRTLAEVHLGHLLDPADVTRITVARRPPAAAVNELETFVFARVPDDREPTPGAWEMLEPSNAAGSRFALEGLATRAADLTIAEVLPEDELEGNLAPEALRLADPVARMTFETAAGETLPITLGRSSVAGRAYARIGDTGPAYVVNDALHRRLSESDPAEWRDRAIFGPAAQEASRIAVDAPGGPEADAKDAPALAMGRVLGTWRLTAPVQTHVDSVARAEWLNALSLAQAQGFVSDRSRKDLAVYGLDPASRPTELVLEQDVRSPAGEVETERRLLRIGRPLDLSGELRYAMRADLPRSSIFTITGDTISALLPAAQTLIGRTVLPVSASEVRAIEITPAAPSPDTPPAGEAVVENGASTNAFAFRLARTLDGWSRAASPQPQHEEVAASEARVTELLNLLTRPVPGITWLPDEPADNLDADAMAVALAELLELDEVTYLGSIVVTSFSEIPLPKLIQVFSAPPPRRTSGPAGETDDAAVDSGTPFPLLVSDGRVVRFDPSGTPLELRFSAFGPEERSSDSADAADPGGARADDPIPTK